MFYPIVLKIGGRRVVVVGGGTEAEAKVESLRQAGANVALVSPQAYESTDLAGAFLVIVVAADSETKDRVWRDAQTQHVLLNTVDDERRCDFIMPSVLRRDDLIVAVSTSGKSPAFAAWLQRRIAEFVTAEFGRAVNVLGSIRGEVRRRFQTMAERKRAYQQIIDSDIVDWIRDCDDASAQARVHKIIEDL